MIKMLALLTLALCCVAAWAGAEEPLEPNSCDGVDVDLGTSVYLQANRSCGSGAVLTTPGVSSFTMSNYCPQFTGFCGDIAGWFSFMTWTQPNLGTRPVVLMATVDGKLRFCEHDGTRFICRYQIDIKTGTAGPLP